MAVLLEYERRQRLSRFFITGCFVVSLASTIAAVTLYRAAAAPRAIANYADCWKKAEQFTLPPEKVAWEGDPASAAKLRADDRQYISTQSSAASPAALALPFDITFVTGYACDSLFLHKLTTSSGVSKLVGLSVNDRISRADEPYQISIWYQIFLNNPGNSVGPITCYDRFPKGSAAITFFAGQPDPNDAAHFTVRVIVNGEEQILGGRLQDDGKLIMTRER